MKKNLPVLRQQNKIQHVQSTDTQNLPKNQPILKNKHVQSSIMINTKLPLPSHTKKENLSTDRDDPKWKILAKFMTLASKAHYLYRLKFSTLFLAYSMAQKTVHMVGQTMNIEYWIVVCLFLSMKLKDLSILVRVCISPSKYMDFQLEILNYLDLNLNFINMNTILSQYLHSVDQLQRYFIYYLLEIALSQRQNLKKYYLQQIIISVMFVLSSHRLQFSKNQKIDGYQFDRIEECAKIIIVGQTYASERSPFLYKKYKTQRMKFVGHGIIPKIENLTLLLTKKAGIKKPRQPKIVGLYKNVSDQNRMDEEENQAQDNDNVFKYY